MPEEILFETESKRSRDDVAEMLRSIATKVERGDLTLRAGDQSVSIDIPQQPTFEVKVERETSATGPSELGLELELEWTEGEGGDGDLSIE
ncbi:amphi-Trp domain-containing protein [Haloplanus sp. GCM10025708]|uniref:amphi-Trp domain-containing protein n=1 Tax=Haloferacaceae TaxID=1644056 RepID=UPI00360B3AD4